MKIFQKGFNYSQDGPGNRLVYHLSGCNMRCLWCANPEGMTASEGGKSYTPEELIKEAESCRMMFFDGGGVTFTGGEATLAAEELIEALKGLKEKGIHTALETNGTSPKLFDILEHTDFLIMDFKHFDDEKMKEYTGISTEQIKNNYEEICKRGRQCLVRIPLIAEFNGGCEKGFAEYLSAFDTKNVVFEFLKYHEFGKNKWKTEYKIKNGFVTEETVNCFKEEFKKHGLNYIET